MPEFYHCNLMVDGEKGSGHFKVDMTKEAVLADVCDPMVKRDTILFDGFFIPAPKVKRLKISRTEQPARFYIERHNAKMRSAGIGDLATIRDSLPVEEGVDVTKELLAESKQRLTAEFAKTINTAVAAVARGTTGTKASAADQAKDGPLSTPKVPSSIQDSLARFRTDHSDPARVAFLMMKFGNTAGHGRIHEAIKTAFAAHGIECLRSDGKQYHDELFGNVLTYMHGCGMGIAVFERLEKDEFNPNVSLEVGYMMALGIPVLLLKDKTIPILHADLMGRLYKNFDTQNPDATVPPEVATWLKDKGLGQ